MWASNGDDEWLIMELKQSFVVEHVKLAFQANQEKESVFDILGSVDKIGWEPILTKTASCWFSGDPQVFEFPQSKAGKEFKYIRLVGHGNSVDSWNCISEVKILGYRYKKNISYENLPVKVFPNPASDFFNIRIDDPLISLSFIKIVNQYGAIVLNQKLEGGLKEERIPIDLKSGVYTLQFGSENITLFSQKLVVIN
jgi:hypothetical protein